MINFLKNRTWEDYIIAIVLGTIFLGLFLFIIGFFWGFEDKTMIMYPTKTSVSKLLKRDELNWLNQNGSITIDNSNLFIMMGDLVPEMGTMYSMVALAISGFSFIMLGLLELFVVILGSFLFEFILIMIKKLKNKS